MGDLGPRSKALEGQTSKTEIPVFSLINGCRIKKLVSTERKFYPRFVGEVEFLPPGGVKMFYLGRSGPPSDQIFKSLIKQTIGIRLGPNSVCWEIMTYYGSVQRGIGL